MLYGLHVLPLTARQVGQVQAVYTRHLRALARFQSHLTSESTVA